MAEEDPKHNEGRKEALYRRLAYLCRISIIRIMRLAITDVRMRRTFSTYAIIIVPTEITGQLPSSGVWFALPLSLWRPRGWLWLSNLPSFHVCAHSANGVHQN